MSALSTEMVARAARERRRRADVSEVLVIGGAGYLGSCLVPLLLDRGYRATVMDALIYGGDGINGFRRRSGFQFIEGDLRSEDALRRAAQNADAIVHLGAVVGDPACALDEELTRDVNVRATRTIAEVACELGIERLVFASTCSVYGSSDGILTEESATAPVSLYAQSKLDSEELLLAMQDKDFAPVVLRFGTFYGHSPRPRFDLIVNLLTANAVTKGIITIFGGTQWRPFVHVADGAASIIAALETPLETVAGQIFNVGSDEQNHTLGEVAAMIAEAVPNTRVVVEPPATEEANYHVSFEKIRSQLGFTPSHSLREGFLEIKDAIEQGLVVDHSDARYDNKKTLVSNGFGNGRRPGE